MPWKNKSVGRRYNRDRLRKLRLDPVYLEQERKRNAQRMRIVRAKERHEKWA